MSNGPPSAIAPGALVALLSQKPRPSKVIDFAAIVPAAKGTPFEKIRIVVPASKAHGEAQLAAHTRLRDEIKLPLDQWNSEAGQAILSDLTAKEMLCRTLYSEQEIAPGQWLRLLVDSKDVEKVFSSDEVAVLFDVWLQTNRELGPRLSVLTPDEAKSWVETLKGGYDFLARMSSPDLETLVRGFHRLLVELEQNSSGSDHQLSLGSTSQDTLESTQTTSATHTSSCGEPQKPLAEFSTDLLSDDEAAVIAAKMSRGEF